MENVTAEEFYKHYVDFEIMSKKEYTEKEIINDSVLAMKKFAEYHVKEALKKVVETGLICLDVYNTQTHKLAGGILTKDPSYPPSASTESPFYVKTRINEASVMKAYPLTEIK